MMKITNLLFASSLLALTACAATSSNTADGGQKSETQRQKMLHEICYKEAREVGGKSSKELHSVKDVLFDERNDTDQTQRLKRVCHKLVQANLTGMPTEEQHAMLDRECKMAVEDNTRSMDPRQLESAAKMKRLCDELTGHKP